MMFNFFYVVFKEVICGIIILNIMRENKDAFSDFMISLCDFVVMMLIQSKEVICLSLICIGYEEMKRCI